MERFNRDHWALILGGSSGFGLATAKKLNRHGMNVFVVHRDRRGAMSRIDKEFDELRKNESRFLSLNTNALTNEGRHEILVALSEAMGKTGRIRLLLHSIAFGNLKPTVVSQQESASDLAVTLLADRLNLPKEKLKEAVEALIEEGVAPLHSLKDTEYGTSILGEQDMELTIYSMGSSLLSWVQEAHKRQLFCKDARVIGLTSEGNQVAWKGYAAVAAAKVTLESISRAIAMEFAQFGIRSNVIQAGVTPTPALKLIPGGDRMLNVAKLRNPYRRTTQPEDVANFIALMCTDEAAWVNGSIIRVDGGEQIASF